MWELNPLKADLQSATIPYGLWHIYKIKGTIVLCSNTMAPKRERDDFKHIYDTNNYTVPLRIDQLRDRLWLDEHCELLICIINVFIVFVSFLNNFNILEWY